jgi:hypothetical protein
MRPVEQSTALTKTVVEEPARHEWTPGANQLWLGRAPFSAGPDGEGEERDHFEKEEQMVEEAKPMVVHRTEEEVRKFKRLIGRVAIVFCALAGAGMFVMVTSHDGSPKYQTGLFVALLSALLMMYAAGSWETVNVLLAHPKARRAKGSVQ